MVLAAEELEISVMFQASHAECPRSNAAARIPSPQTRIVKYAGYLTRLFKAVPVSVV